MALTSPPYFLHEIKSSDATANKSSFARTFFSERGAMFGASYNFFCLLRIRGFLCHKLLLH